MSHECAVQTKTDFLYAIIIRAGRLKIIRIIQNMTGFGVWRYSTQMSISAEFMNMTSMYLMICCAAEKELWCPVAMSDREFNKKGIRDSFGAFVMVNCDVLSYDSVINAPLERKVLCVVRTDNPQPLC